MATTFPHRREKGPLRKDRRRAARFSAVPLGTGLLLVAALVGRFRWIAAVASVVAPLLAVVTIFVMTIPVDLDTVSTVTLAGCHLSLVPISLLAVQRLR